MSHQPRQSVSTERAADTQTAADNRTGCPDCGYHRIDRSGTDTYCPECGLVVSDQELDRGLPSLADDARHVGPGVSTQWLQQGTCVGSGADAGGVRTARLQQFNRRLGSADRTLYRGLRELRAICEELELGTEIRERAAYLYRQSVARGLLSGRGIEEFAAAAVLAATREADQPITVDWLAEAAFASRSEIPSTYRTLVRELGLQILPPKPRAFVPRLAAELELPQAIERSASRVVKQARDAGVTVGKHPTGMAGAAIYAVAQREQQGLTQEEVGDVAGVDLVTISRRWREINDELGVLADDEG